MCGAGNKIENEMGGPCNIYVKEKGHILDLGGEV
jgi:hypothetical protein